MSAGATRAAVPQRRDSEAPYRSALTGLALTVAAGFAFWPRYLARLGAVDAYTHLHALLMTAWCLLLTVQPLLLRAGRLAWHRTLGRSSYALVPALACCALLLTHVRMRSVPDEALRAEAANFYLPLSMTVLFVAAYALAIVFRRQPALHARFMFCTSLSAIDPVLGRLLGFYLPPLDVSYQVLTFGVTDLLLVTLIAVERRQGRARWALPLVLALYLLAHLLWFTLAPSASWWRLVAWLRALPLT